MFICFGGVGILRDNSKYKVELGPVWGVFKKCFGGESTTKIVKKYVYIILPILYSIIDNISDANYCFSISKEEGIFDVGQEFHPNIFFDSNQTNNPTDEIKYIPPVYWFGQKLMLAFLFTGNSDFKIQIERYLLGAAKDMLSVWLTLRNVKENEGINTGTYYINGPRWTF